MQYSWRYLGLCVLLILGVTGVVWAGDDFEFSGEITENGQEDTYEIDLEEGTGVIITAEASRGSDLDTVLRLENPDGDTVAENDDYEYPDSTNSQIIYVVDAAGEYTVVVSNYEDTFGEYDLTVEVVSQQEAIDLRGEANTTPQRDPDFVYEGETDGDGEDYTIELEAGQGVIAAAYGLSDEMDTMLTATDPNGEEIINNDDRGDYETLDSQIPFIAAESGEYTITINNFNDETGEYRLEIYLASEEEVAYAVQALRVVLTGPVQTLETENFIIHYTLEGRDETDEDFVDDVAETVEEVLAIQMDLGWTPPPSDEGEGGDDRYDVYIVDLDDIYGYASSSASELGDNPNSDTEEESAQAGYLVLDNDYSEFDDANRAMRATVAHEFHHVVQFGYDRMEPMNWYAEATSSWMETITFPDEEEATIYVEDVYNYPEICFGAQGDADVSGLANYGNWLFLDYATNQIDESFVPELWNNIIVEDGWDALEATLNEYDMTIPEAVAQYHLNNLVRDYALADDFDGKTVWLEESIDDTGDWTVTGEGIQQLAANYFEFAADEDTYSISLDTDADLELYAIGIDGDDADVFYLGDEGVIDNDGYDNFYLMVFNTDYDSNVDDCSYEDYTIQVDTTNDDANEVTATLNAENFEELEMND